MEIGNTRVIKTASEEAAIFKCSIESWEAERSMLLRAINNRTRERNYANLCLSLAEGQLSEEEFDEEILKNEDRYVITFQDSTTPEEIMMAVNLTDKVLDVETEDDFRELFSISSASFANLTKAIESK